MCSEEDGEEDGPEDVYSIERYLRSPANQRPLHIATIILSGSVVIRIVSICSSVIVR